MRYSQDDQRDHRPYNGPQNHPPVGSSDFGRSLLVDSRAIWGQNDSAKTWCMVQEERGSLDVATVQVLGGSKTTESQERTGGVGMADDRLYEERVRGFVDRRDLKQPVGYSG